MKIIDFQNEGLGDVILGCWIAHAAHVAGKEVKINPRKFGAIPPLFDIPQVFITSENGGNWTSLSDSGFTHELERAHYSSQTRYEFWVNSVGLEGLPIVRPVYKGDGRAEEWASGEWQKILDKPEGLKIILLPETTRNTRSWPLVHWVQLADELQKEHNCCVMGMQRENIHPFNLYQFWGQPLENFAAMLHQADLVISADSGGAHFAATLKTRVLALMGPTIGKVVFGHDAYVQPLHVDPEIITCVGCNFSSDNDFKKICNEACSALYLLSPKKVREEVAKIALQMDKRVSSFV